MGVIIDKVLAKETTVSPPAAGLISPAAVLSRCPPYHLAFHNSLYTAWRKRREVGKKIAKIFNRFHDFDPRVVFWSIPQRWNGGEEFKSRWPNAVWFLFFQ